MKQPKFMTLLAIFLFSTMPVFATSIGFTSVRSGFGWWLLAIVIAVLSAVIAICTAGAQADVGGSNEFFYITLGILGCGGAIAGFWIFPTIWCGFFGAVLGSLIALGWLMTDEKSAFHSFCLSILSVLGIIYFALVLPQSWWIWKYFSFVSVSSLVSLLFSYFAKLSKKSIACSTLSVFMLFEFIAFWIVERNSANKQICLILIFSFIGADGLFLFITYLLYRSSMQSERRRQQDKQRKEQEEKERKKEIQRIEYEKKLEKDGPIAIKIRENGIDEEYYKFDEKVQVYDSALRSVRRDIENAKKELEKANVERKREGDLHPIKDFLNLIDNSQIDLAKQKISAADMEKQNLNMKRDKAQSELSRFLKTLDNDVKRVLLEDSIDETIDEFQKLQNRRKFESEENKKRIVQEIKTKQEENNAINERNEQLDSFNRRINEVSDFITVLQSHVMSNENLNFQLLSELEKHLLKIKEQKTLMSNIDRERMKNNREKILEMFKNCRNLPKSNVKIIKNLLNEVIK